MPEAQQQQQPHDAPRNDNAQQGEQQPPQQTKKSALGDKKKRKKLFLIFGCVLAVLAVISFIYWGFIGRNQVSTDDAYVAAEIAQVTPSVGGTIQAINVNDTQKVTKGDVLVVIDATDAKLALAQAQAQVATSEADLDKARIDLDRRKALIASGSVSAEEVTTAENAFNAAEAAMAATKAQADQAMIDVKRTVVTAPISGVIAKRQVQLGQRVQIGTPLLSIVPMDQVHVDANFKEVQLRKVKIGQTVELESDLYGSGTKYHGRVIGFSGGTGAAFALVPAQNATGNWIKVVQRLPVRVAIDPQELRAHPLQVGLSMTAKIDLTSNADDSWTPEIKDDDTGEGK